MEEEVRNIRQMKLLNLNQGEDPDNYPNKKAL